jgi:hypothetical protein
MSRKKAGKPALFQPRRGTIKKQLEGDKDCQHPKARRVIQTNRNGRQFIECDACDAFLGWVK